MLQLVEAQCGVRPSDLNTPPCPDLMVPLLHHFGRMSIRRGSNGWGANPLSWADLLAYQALTGITFTAWEVDVLTTLEGLLLASQAPIKAES